MLTVCDDVKDCQDGDDEQNCDCARNEVSKQFFISHINYTALIYILFIRQKTKIFAQFCLTSHTVICI